MRQRLSLFVLALFLVSPTTVWAADACGPTQESTCRRGTETCSCTIDLGDRSIDKTITASGGADCSALCQGEINDSEAEGGEYHFSCTNLCNDKIEPGQGSLSKTSLNAAPDTAPKKDPIVPQLNVPPPGFNAEAFANATMVDPNTGRQESNLLGIYIQAWYAFAIVGGAIIAVVMLVVGGFQLTISRGSHDAVGKAKKRMENAVVGLILLLLAYNIAFIISPDTVSFDALTIQSVDGVEYFPPEGEDDDVTPNSSLSGESVAIENDGNLIMKAPDPYLEPEAAEALLAAAAWLKEEYGENIRVTSATRDLQKQATLFYNNCLARGGVCSPPTCNPASSSVVTKSGGRFILTGELEGVRGSSAIISGIANNGELSHCPHTSGIAVDVWCQTGGNWQTDVDCQERVIEAMIGNGFCRLASEPWHFELNSKKVSSKCSTSYTSAAYTRSSGTYTPESDCKIWDFKKHLCITRKVK